MTSIGRKVFAQISISLYLEPVLVREIFASDPKIMSRDSVKKTEPKRNTKVRKPRLPKKP